MVQLTSMFSATWLVVAASLEVTAPSLALLLDHKDLNNPHHPKSVSALATRREVCNDGLGFRIPNLNTGFTIWGNF